MSNKGLMSIILKAYLVSAFNLSLGGALFRNRGLTFNSLFGWHRLARWVEGAFHLFVAIELVLGLIRGVVLRFNFR